MAISDEDLLLLLRGGGLAGEGDLQDPAYRARLQDAAQALAESDALVEEGRHWGEDPLRDVLPEDEEVLRMAGEELAKRVGGTPEALLSEAWHARRRR